MKPWQSFLARDVLRATCGAPLDLVLPRTTPFVVISSGRSGSNLLSNLMRSHRRLVQHGEVFGEYLLESRYVRNSINRVGVRAHFDKRLRRMHFEKSTGIKILYENLQERYGNVRGIPGTEALLPHMQSRQDIRYIHLVRRDKFATLISSKLARAKGRWTGGDYGKLEVMIPPDWLAERFEFLETWENRVHASLFEQRYLKLVYEEMIEEREEAMRRVFEFLGLRCPELTTNMKKQNLRKKSQTVTNYFELKEFFSDTRFALFFDE